ncbi:MAG: hypothetical protein M0021_06885 [Clostridia bacterium]|nr:hypothetical protein [Clostridia bacterium]
MAWFEQFIDAYLVEGILQMQYGRAYVVFAIFICFFAGLTCQIWLSWSLGRQLTLFRAYRRDWHLGRQANPGKLWQGVFEQYRLSAAKGNEQVNTGVLLEDAYESVKIVGRPLEVDLERVARVCLSILLMLGLIGTFLGLTQSLFEIKGVLQQMGVDTLAKGDLLGQIIQRLLIPLQRMSTAFVTSLAGIGSAMILSVTALILRVEQRREAFFIEAEDFLDNELFPTLPRPNSIQGAADVLGEKFQILFAGLSKELAGNFEQALNQMSAEMKELYRTLQGSLKEIAEVSTNLSQSGEAFAGGAKLMERISFGLGQQVNLMGKSTGALGESIASVSYAVTRLDGALEGMALAVRNSNDILAATAGRVEANLGKLGADMEKVSSAANSQIQATDRLSQVTGDLEKRTAGMDQGLQDVAQCVREIEQGVKGTGQEIREMGQGIKLMDQGLKKIDHGLEEVRRDMLAVKQETACSSQEKQGPDSSNGEHHVVMPHSGAG